MNMSDSNINEGNMIATNIRFDRKLYKVVKDVSEEYRVPMARLVRISVNGTLDRYLPNVKCLNSQQSDELIHKVNDLTNATLSVKNELNKIGVNLNQRIRVLRQQNDIMERSGKVSFDAIQAQMKEKQVREKELQKYEQDLERINQVMADYDVILKEVGEGLCQLQR